jgi:hypothetical protein
MHFAVISDHTGDRIGISDNHASGHTGEAIGIGDHRAHVDIVWPEFDASVRATAIERLKDRCQTAYES